ncbi:hypothetical protein ACFS4T_23660 [Pseudomonas lini]
MRITADGFKASADLPDTLQLNQLELTGDGDLKKTVTSCSAKPRYPQNKARSRYRCKARSTPRARRSPALI